MLESAIVSLVPGGRTHRAYRVATDVGRIAPSVSTEGRLCPTPYGRRTGAMWTAWRKLRRATIDDVVLAVRAAGVELRADHARTYAHALDRAGYLRRVSRGHRLTGRGTYAVDRDSGPLAPMEREGGMHDPNTGALTPWRETVDA